MTQASPPDHSRRNPVQYAVALVRSLLHLGWMAATIIPYGSYLLLRAATGASKETIYRIGVSWLDKSVSGARWILGIDYRVHGLENLPRPGQNRGVILLVKHQSTYDTFVMPLVLRHVVLAYVFKKQLLSIPFFGWGMAKMDMIFIDREQRTKAFKKVLEQGRRILSAGHWVIMFPEGTRVARGEVGQYKYGGARLALDAQAHVVPVAVTSGRCWPAKAIVKFPGVVDISFGKPIAPEGLTAAELTAQVQDWIETEMRRLDPQAYSAESAAPVPSATSTPTSNPDADV